MHHGLIYPLEDVLLLWQCKIAIQRARVHSSTRVHTCTGISSRLAPAGDSTLARCPTRYTCTGRTIPVVACTGVRSKPNPTQPQTHINLQTDVSRHRSARLAGRDLIRATVRLEVRFETWFLVPVVFEMVGTICELYRYENGLATRKGFGRVIPAPRPIRCCLRDTGFGGRRFFLLFQCVFFRSRCFSSVGCVFPCSGCRVSLYLIACSAFASRGSATGLLLECA